MKWLSVLTPFLPLLNAAVGLVLAKAISTPKSHERAMEIAKIADDVVGLVLAENPTWKYAQALDWVRQRLADAGLTNNAEIIKRVAVAALARAGLKP